MPEILHAHLGTGLRDIGKVLEYMVASRNHSQLMRYLNYATQVKNIPSYEFKQMTWECRLSFWPSKMEEYLHMIGNNVHSDPGPAELKYGYDDIRIGHHIFSINSFGIGNQAHAPNCRTIHQDRGF